MRNQYALLNVDDIQFDTDNPRIRKSVEKHGKDVTADIINFALRTSDDGTSSGVPSFERLKKSILTNQSILSPIVVINKEKAIVSLFLRFDIIKGQVRQRGKTREIFKMIHPSNRSTAVRG